MVVKEGRLLWLMSLDEKESRRREKNCVTNLGYLLLQLPSHEYIIFSVYQKIVFLLSSDKNCVGQFGQLSSLVTSVFLDNRTSCGHFSPHFLSHTKNVPIATVFRRFVPSFQPLLIAWMISTRIRNSSCTVCYPVSGVLVWCTRLSEWSFFIYPKPKQMSVLFC